MRRPAIAYPRSSGWRRSLLVLTCALPACARGCTDSPPRHAATAPAQAPIASAALVDNVERDLAIRLPERRSGTIVPGLATLPWRKLSLFEPKVNLVARIDAKGLHVLGDFLPTERLDDQAILAMLRKSADQWRLRAGIAPTRLVLAVDADVSPVLVGRIRRVAMTAGQWRVVALARDGSTLVELMLNPPPETRPAP
jgi:hypothetical protein